MFRHPLPALIAIASFSLTGCSAPAPEPTPPPPVQTSVPTPPSAPIAQPEFENWLDAPQTAGNWSYRDGTGLSFATFAQAGQPAVFGVECRKADRTVRLVRGSQSASPQPMRIRTETTERLLTASPSSDGRPLLIVELGAQDRLLDAMAFSRGRFAVETGGLPTLYLPAWAEVTRVIEDCR